MRTVLSEMPNILGIGTSAFQSRFGKLDFFRCVQGVVNPVDNNEVILTNNRAMKGTERHNAPLTCVNPSAPLM